MIHNQSKPFQICSVEDIFCLLSLEMQELTPCSLLVLAFPHLSATKSNQQQSIGVLSSRTD